MIALRTGQTVNVSTLTVDGVKLVVETILNADGTVSSTQSYTAANAAVVKTQTGNQVTNATAMDTRAAAIVAAFTA